MNANSNCKSKDWFQANGYTLITPELAAKWLTKNTRNRQIRENFVNELVKKIKMNQWQPNTLDSIGFFVDGTLANGQHRLTAIAKAGIPVYAKVEYDIPNEAAICIDAGKSRTASDNIRIMTGEAFYTSKISKMIRTVSVGGKNLTHEDHLKISIRYKDQIVAVKDMFEGLPKYLSITSVMASVFTALMAGVPEDTLRQFVKVLGSGRAHTDAEETILTFKNRLNEEYYNHNDKRRRDYTYEIKRCQNVIWNFTKGKSISKFLAPEKYRYPMIEFNLSD